MRRVAPRSHLGCPEDCVNSSLNLQIAYRRIDELKPDPANPRRHAKKQVRQIAESIRTFGFVAPILIDRDGNVIAGHGRLAACRPLGIPGADTVPRPSFPDATSAALVGGDNRLPRNRHLGRSATCRAAQGARPDRPRFQYRGHRLRNGRDRPSDRIARRSARTRRPGRYGARNSGGPAAQQNRGSMVPRSSSDLVRQRSRCRRLRRADGRGTRRDVVFTDPPYNVPIDGHASGLGAIHHRPFPMASGEMRQSRIHRVPKPGFAATSPRSASTARCTTSAWTGVTSKS